MKMTGKGLKKKLILIPNCFLDLMAFSRNLDKNKYQLILKYSFKRSYSN